MIFFSKNLLMTQKNVEQDVWIHVAVEGTPSVYYSPEKYTAGTYEVSFKNMPTVLPGNAFFIHDGDINTKVPINPDDVLVTENSTFTVMVPFDNAQIMFASFISFSLDYCVRKV